MPIKIDMSGLEKLKKNVDELSRGISVKWTDLYDAEFMQKHTQSTDFASFVAASGFKAETVEELKAIPDEPWDEYVRTNSDFSSWEEMQYAAGKENLAKQAFKGLK